MSIRSDAAHSALRVGAFLMAVLAAAWFTWELRRKERLALLVLVAGVGLAPVSVGYQALLSLPTLWIGWAAVWTMGALALKPDSVWTRSGIIFAFALALVIHEANAVFLIWPFVLTTRRGQPDRARLFIRQTAGCAVVLVAYGILSLALRRQTLAAFPGSMYDGAALSLNPRDAGFALNAYSWSGLPGFDSWLMRSGGAGARWWLSPPEWLHRAFAGATAYDVAGALVLGAAFWIGTMPCRAERGKEHPFTVRTFFVLFFAAFAPNLVLSLTSKYQVWAHQRMWPYYYTSMSYLVWVVLLVNMLSRALSLIPAARGRRAAGVSVAAAAALLAIGIASANREAVNLLRKHPFDHMENYVKWFPPR
jgi:hypothetical protein